MLMEIDVEPMKCLYKFMYIVLCVCSSECLPFVSLLSLRVPFFSLFLLLILFCTSVSMCFLFVASFGGTRHLAAIHSGSTRSLIDAFAALH